MNFDRNLSLLRKKAGLSQEDLAFAIGVSRQTVFSWEAGISAPSILMLKKISEAVNATADDLLNGYEVNKLPAKIDKIQLTRLGKHEGSINYSEIPNWFIPLRLDAEVCFGLYDKGQRDFSYHLAITNKAVIHNKKGFEILVEEYDPQLNKARSYSCFAQEKDNRVSFLGMISSENGTKRILTYKDAPFLKNWQFGKNNHGTRTLFENGEDYVLEFGGIKRNVVKIGYFDSDETKDPKHDYFEVFLNKNNESLLWRRYQKSEKVEEGETIDGQKYEIRYVCLTSRLS